MEGMCRSRTLVCALASADALGASAWSPQPDEEQLPAQAAVPAVALEAVMSFSEEVLMPRLENLYQLQSQPNDP